MAYSWTVVRTSEKDNTDLKSFLYDGWYVVHANKIGEQLEYILEYEYDEEEDGNYED